MEEMSAKIGLGGGCHWCTEAVVASLKGVEDVQQGWIAATSPNDSFSEAVIVTYNSAVISLKDLIEIHLHTHSATANHSMRSKYRSAVYYFSAVDEALAKKVIAELQPDFAQPIITEVLPFFAFKQNKPEQLNYYYTDPERPFCKLYINPKIQMLRQKFSRLTNSKQCLTPQISLVSVPAHPKRHR